MVPGVTHCTDMLGFYFLINLFFLAVPRGLWDFSSLTRDGTQDLGSESTES